MENAGRHLWRGGKNGEVLEEKEEGKGRRQGRKVVVRVVQVLAGEGGGGDDDAAEKLVGMMVVL